MTIGGLVGKVPSKRNLSRAMPPTTGSLHRTGIVSDQYFRSVHNEQTGDNQRCIFWPSPGFWKVRRDQSCWMIGTRSLPLQPLPNHCHHCQTVWFGPNHSIIAIIITIAKIIAKSLPPLSPLLLTMPNHCYD